LEEFYFISLCVALGLTSGFIGGLLGIGGGVIIVPALVLYYDFSATYPPETNLLIAVATSLACIIFTSASAAFTQYRAGRIRWDLFRKLVIFLLLGSFAAGWIAPLLPAEVFRGFIGLFLGCVAIVMLSSWQPNPSQQFPANLGAAGIGLGGGMAAGLAGIAGGNVIVPTLVYFNTPIHNATATSSALGVPIALTGTLGYLFAAQTPYQPGLLGYIHLYAFAPIILGTLIAAPLGVRAAHRVPAARLKRAFGALLIIVSLRMLYSLTSL
jgi:uncharacterized membrane protein YfcA